MRFFVWRKGRSPSSGLSHPKDFQNLATGPLLFPGVAVDAEEAFLFHQTADQELAKRSLDSGKLLWTAPLPGVLLAAIGSHLWVLEVRHASPSETTPRLPAPSLQSQIRLVAISSATGKTAHTTDWLDIPLNLPTLRYESRQGSSVEIRAGWSAADTALWIRIDRRSWYAGGAPVSIQFLQDSNHTASAFIKVIPTTGQVTLVKNAASGNTTVRETAPKEERLISFPTSCQTEICVESDWLAERGLRPLRSAQTSRHYVLLQRLPVDRFSHDFLLLQVFCRERSLLRWQQCIGTYYVEPAHC